MDEFEKWYKIWRMPGDRVSHKYNALAGWKAALEWVKSKLVCEICPGDVEYFIDKELKNLD